MTSANAMNGNSSFKLVSENAGHLDSFSSTITRFHTPNMKKMNTVVSSTTKITQEIESQRKKEQKKLNQILESIEADRKHSEKVAGYLKLHEYDKNQRYEALYRRWCYDVFAPIQEQVLEQLANRSAASIEKRRRKLFDEYLAVATKKHGGVYRDILISDYNPLKSRDVVLRYSTAGIIDPLKGEQLQRDREHRFEQRLGLRAPPRSLSDSRHALPITQWDKLEATNVSHYAALWEREQELGRPLKAENPNTKSSLVFDHYNLNSQSPHAEQVYRGKRIDPSRDRRDYNILC